jgi:lipopolysaccharide transport system ATP-binding protein
MSDTIIKVEGVGKSYRIRHKQPAQYSALRDVIADKVMNAFRRKPHRIGMPATVENFWALKNVSFEVGRGEVLGVIGRNGAGKSTLLKILSRITEPTVGRVEIDGRVASLLEVGTGFHPELTGRENIQLNGAILGMSRVDIRRRFDEIAAFAEIENFLDTPVKHYSSGMYVRLAFAVAAHLEPDILIIDEVLAVGDAKFQEKCLGKMRDSSNKGRTVLFVSHNMSAVMQLTSRAIVISGGAVEFIGAPSDAVERYIHGERFDRVVEFDVRNAKRRYQGTGDVKITSLRFDRPLAHFKVFEPIRFSMRVLAERGVERLRAGMTVFSRNGSPVGNCFSPEVDGPMAGEECEIAITLSSARLAPGGYYCGVSVGSGNHRTSRAEYDVVSDTLFFEIMPEESELGAMSYWTEGWGSIVFPDLAIKKMPTEQVLST